ncbi:hypothetical protein SJAV_19040 [Sulfurisphaera javensis]|uniref:CAAX prenyl protease 2/Lysostaphin resistance protein A-like domain-containing protein n=1 Tax=Sulfurisphaera javensis TaxID=2049879 RepID=A0AAT9GTJ8_9CREN
MKIEELFAGIILPLIVIPEEFFVYSVIHNFTAIYVVGIIVIIGEIISAFLAKILTKKKLKIEINKGLVFLVLIIPLSFFPGLTQTSSPSFYTILIPAGIVGGICEEIIYRGYVLSDTTSIFIQGILWGILHIFDGLLFFLWTIVIGIIFGFIAKRYGILPTMLIHVISNILRILL